MQRVIGYVRDELELVETRVAKGSGFQPTLWAFSLLIRRMLLPGRKNGKSSGNIPCVRWRNMDGPLALLHEIHALHGNCFHSGRSSGIRRYLNEVTAMNRGAAAHFGMYL